MVIAKDTGSNFEPAPEGLWPAVCCDIVDLGNVTGQFGTMHAVRIIWQITERMEDGQRYTASRRFRVSLHENSALRPFLETWRGKKFKTEELQGFPLDRLIGVPCQLDIQHNERDNRIWANVTSAVRLGSAERLDIENYTRVRDRESQTDTGAATEDMPF